LEKLHASSD